MERTRGRRRLGIATIGAEGVALTPTIAHMERAGLSRAVQPPGATDLLDDG